MEIIHGNTHVFVLSCKFLTSKHKNMHVSPYLFHLVLTFTPHYIIMDKGLLAKRFWMPIEEDSNKFMSEHAQSSQLFGWWRSVDTLMSDGKTSSAAFVLTLIYWWNGAWGWRCNWPNPAGTACCTVQYVNMTWCHNWQKDTCTPVISCCSIDTAHSSQVCIIRKAQLLHLNYVYFALKHALFKTPSPTSETVAVTMGHQLRWH